MPTSQHLNPESTQRGWDEHNLSQLRYFHTLSLREKLQAVEGMADVVRHFRQLRAQGGFKSASSKPDALESVATVSGKPMLRTFGN